MPSLRPAHPLAEVAFAFLRLGLTSFGGPVAHLGYFHEEIVRRRRWLDEAEYADLVALCQFLPGPASSQVAFALGQKRAGLPGALLASLCFTLPSAILMIAFGYGISTLTGPHAGQWLHGLKLAAVAVVAQAVWVMGRKLCPDVFRQGLALVTAGAVWLRPDAAVQIGAMALGSAAGWVWYRELPPTEPRSDVSVSPRVHLWAMLALGGYALLLVALPMAATATGNKPLQVFDGFYRSGALVFGGGHVVLPLLRAEVVPHGWITDEQFLAGYGAAQALPGPLFTFAAYLGTVIQGGRHAWLGGLGCLVALFLPAWLLIGGALPFWNRLRGQAGVQAALRGANAAVVGVLLAALYHPVGQESITNLRDLGAVIVAFALLTLARFPSWAVVLLMAAAGRWWL